MTLTSSRTNRFGTRIQGIGRNYTSLFIITTKPDAIYLTTGEASSILSRKENNCYISIVGINSNAPQVAPRTTRGYPTSTVISLTQNFFFSVEPQELVSPGKGGVKEMPVKNDSIIYCIKYTKPWKEQNLLTFI